MQEKTTVARVALKYGIIFGVISIVWSAIIFAFDLMFTPGLSYVGYVILAIGIYLAMKEYKTGNDGFLSYGEGLGLGALKSAVFGLLGAIFATIYTQLIDTGFSDRMIAGMQTELEKQGLDDAQIDAAIQMTQKFSSPGISFAVGVLGTIFVGFLLSLIIAAILKKNRPVFD